ncbi:MAG: hypothetical protein M0P57_02590 [Syntrophales bacterium]|jgi:hypothetical protein|nr:hypothetical protein [Syntrophales bacterium]MDY0045168.1 hypothetical protein [Syntrophales bacterium]
MMRKYYEVVVKGSFDLMKGFVLGFCEGKGIKGEAIFSEEHYLENESKFGQLMRLIGAKGGKVTLIVGSGFHDMINRAIENRGLKDELKVVSVKEVCDAYFSFEYKAYSRELGEKLKKLFGSLPEGLRIEKGKGPDEKVMPEGRGIEAYAPLHEYEIKAKGEIHGPVKNVIDFYGAVEHEEMVELGNIKLIYAE